MTNNENDNDNENEVMRNGEMRNEKWENYITSDHITISQVPIIFVSLQRIFRTYAVYIKSKPSFVIRIECYLIFLHPSSASLYLLDFLYPSNLYTFINPTPS